MGTSSPGNLAYIYAIAQVRTAEGQEQKYFKTIDIKKTVGVRAESWDKPIQDIPWGKKKKGNIGNRERGALQVGYFLRTSASTGKTNTARGGFTGR